MSFSEPGETRPSMSFAVKGCGAVAFVSLTAVTYAIARHRIFTGFARHDDEGYMLMSLKSFLDHGWNYGNFTGYGPFYYEFWGGVFTLLGIPVDHDHGRAATLTVWVLVSALLGLATWVLTGSAVLGLMTQLSTFEVLFSLVNEPMHPGGLIVLLLSVLLACACFVRDGASRWPAAVVGGAVMALILVKINVGVFAVAALALVCVVSYPALAGHRWLRPAVEAGVVALPLLLMSSKVGEAWVRVYALHVCAAAFAVVVALRARHDAHRDSRELWWLGGGFLAVGVGVMVATLAAGSSPSWPMNTIKEAHRFVGLRPSQPLALPGWTWVLDLVAVAGAVSYRCLAHRRVARRGGIWAWLVAALCILVGLVMAFAVIVSITVFPPAGTPWVAVSWRWSLLAFAWVALLEPPAASQGPTRFARVLAAPLAVLQALHAYPVAGSQVYWSTLLVIPVGALCVANGARWIAWSRSDPRAWRAPLGVGALAASAVLVADVGIHLKVEFDAVRAHYDSSAPLGLAGAEEVRVSPDDAATYRAVVAAIDANCPAFVMLPGMNSFYLWTNQNPPSGSVAPEVPVLWDDARQERLISATRSIDHLCLLENAPLTRSWAVGKPAPTGPLERYLHQGFLPIAQFGDYQLLGRDGSGSRP